MGFWVLPAGRGDGLEQGPQGWSMDPRAGAGTPGRTEEGAAMSAATLQWAPAGKSALVLCTRRGITE